MSKLSALRLKDLKHNDRCKEFEKKIFHKYDKDLRVYWIPSQLRYSIWSTDRKGKAYMLCVCVGYVDTDSYREPNERDLQAIYSMDLQRKERTFSMSKKIQDYDDDMEAERKKKLRNDLRDISMDRWRSIMENPFVNIPMSF